MVTACNRTPTQGEPGAEAPAVISIWYSLQGHEEQEMLKQFKLINKNHPEVVIKATKVAANGFVDKVWNLQAGGKGPEIFISDRAILFALYEKGAMSPVLADNSDAYPSSLAVFTFNHQPFAAPWLTDVPLLFYRKDRITDLPVNLKEILQKDTIAIKSLDPIIFSSWWRAEGGIISQAGVPALDSPTNSAFLNKLLYLKSQHKLVIDNQALEQFIKGDVNYLLAWGSESIDLNQAKVSWGCVSLSSVLGKNAQALLANTIGIANSSIKTVPALESPIRLIEEELLKPEVESSMQKASGYLPANSNCYESSQSGTFEAEAATALANSWDLEGYALDWKLLSLQDQAWKSIAAGSNIADELAKVQKTALGNSK